MRPDLYRDVYEEQARWEALHGEQARKEGLRSQMTPEVAKRLGKFSTMYPWMSKGTLTSLVRNNTPDDVIAAAAGIEAQAKTTKKHGMMWSGLGDVVHDVGHLAGAPVRVAQGAAKAVGDFGSSLAQIASAYDPTKSEIQQRNDPQVQQTRAGTDLSARAVYEGGKATSRAGLAVAQAPYEAVVGLGREALAGNLSGNGLTTGLSVESQKDVGGQTTVGAAAEQYGKTGQVDLGSGFFPGGKAAELQTQNAREALSIDGHAATPGRLAASLVTEPGTKPYRILSGIVDAGATWYGDPGAMGLKSLGESRAAAKGLGGIATEAQVAKAAEKAGAWGDEVKAAVGLVDGARRSVVPAAVDRYLYSDGFQKIATKLAETRSPYEVWLASDKKMPADVAHELSLLDEPGKVAAALRPHLGLDVLPGDFKGFGMSVTQSAQRQLRAFNVVPETYGPWDDADTFVRNLDNTLANADIMGESRRAVMDEAFRVLTNPTEGGKKRLADTIASTIEKSLVDSGTDPDTAKRLTSWAGDIDRVRHYQIDDLGNDVNFSWVPEGKKQPTALTDLINSGVFFHDPEALREIKLRTGRWAKITSNPGFRVPESAVTALQQEVWKPLQTARPAYFLRVNGEEVARSLASGTFDRFTDWLNFAAFGRGNRTATGALQDLAEEADQLVSKLAEGSLDDAATKAAKSRLNQINDELLKGKTAFDEARVGQQWDKFNLGQAERNLVRTGDWRIVTKEGDRSLWKQGLADEMISMAQDPVIRRVANGGLFDGDGVANARPGLDGIVDWLMNGTGTKFRRQMEAAFPGIDAQRIAEELVDKARLRVSKLGDDPDLREAIATGKFGDAAAWTETRNGRAASAELLDRLERWRQDPASWNMQKVERMTERAGRAGNSALNETLAAKNRFMNFFFGHLYGKTSDYLARSPVFKAEYWNQIDRMMPFLDEEGRAVALANAREAKLGRSRMASLVERSKTPVGEVTLETVEDLAKGYALDHVHNLLYDSSQRSQFFDTWRAAFPYGEAWREVLTRWPKLFVENPQLVRRSQMIVEGARGAGWFHQDPATGEEMFTYPIPGPLADYLGTEFQGSVKGLSLGTSVLPGLGPVASVGAREIIPNTPDTDFIRSLIFPYGEPSSVMGSIAPAWMKKVFAAWQADPQKDRIFANTYVEVVRQLQATGDYGTSPDEKERLLSDAKDRARVITGIRALIQFGGPSAPQIKYLAETKQGDVAAALLAKKLAELQADDYDTAIEKFFDLYGDQAYAYLVGKTKSTVGGQRASSAYGQWERENGDLVRKYPLVAGYFGPQDEGFSSTVYQRQERAGRRERRTASQMVDDAQAMLAGWIYRAQTKKVEGRTDEAAMEWKRQIKADLQTDYPGWNPDAVPNNLPGRIRQLQGAVKDEKISGTEIGKGLTIYFEKRQQAIDAAKQGGLASPFTAKRAAYLRDWLRQVGGDLSSDFKGFDRIWDEVLSRELKDDTTDG